jgi:hypothetical protein
MPPRSPNAFRRLRSGPLAQASFHLARASRRRAARIVGVPAIGKVAGWQLDGRTDNLKRATFVAFADALWRARSRDGREHDALREEALHELVVCQKRGSTRSRALQAKGTASSWERGVRERRYEESIANTTAIASGTKSDFAAPAMKTAPRTETERRLQAPIWRPRDRSR